jgi:hypothetical protein
MRRVTRRAAACLPRLSPPLTPGGGALTGLGSMTCGTDARRFMFAAGMPLQRSWGLGRSATSVTMNIYAYVLPALRQEAADVIDELFVSSRPDSRVAAVSIRVSKKAPSMIGRGL